MDVADVKRSKRIAWLLNHTTMRELEVPLLRSLGFEVYTGKQLLGDIGMRSGSADYSDDLHCSIPPDELEVLNRHNFYEDDYSPEVAGILNRRFGTVMCGMFMKMLREATAHFRGLILMRAFGRELGHNYSDFIKHVGGPDLWRRVRAIGRRFRFAPCYAAITEIEEPLLKDGAVTLPLGIPERIFKNENSWIGGDQRILFFCPSIATAPTHYGRFYRDFKAELGNFPHLIAGTQPIPVDDPAVVGFVPNETLAEWMRTFAVLYYHSREPRHLHYHPLEAIVHGMPVIFMRGGLMDAFGGPDQPGACDTVAEARAKIGRILGGDGAFVEEVRSKQKKILEKFTWDYNRVEWQRLFVDGLMREEFVDPTANGALVPPERFRVAVLFPRPCPGGSLSVAKEFAKLITVGSLRRGAEVDVVFGCPIDADEGGDHDFAELRSLGIQVRSLRWKRIGAEVLGIVNISNLGAQSEVRRPLYLQPVDGGNDFMDCDLWLFVGDRVDLPPAPLRPYGALLFDDVHRYVPEDLSNSEYEVRTSGRIAFAQDAKFVMATTPTAKADANSHAGVPLRKIVQLPRFVDAPKDVDPPRLIDPDHAEAVFDAIQPRLELCVKKAYR